MIKKLLQSTEGRAFYLYRRYHERPQIAFEGEFSHVMAFAFSLNGPKSKDFNFKTEKRSNFMVPPVSGEFHNCVLTVTINIVVFLIIRITIWNWFISFNIWYWPIWLDWASFLLHYLLLIFLFIFFLFLSVGKENYITLALDVSQVLLSPLNAIQNI